MYTITEFRRDLRVVLLASIVPTTLAVIYFTSHPELRWNLLWAEERALVLLSVVTVYSCTVFIVLALRSVQFVRHKGWQRILIVAAICGFAFGIFTAMQITGRPLDKVYVALASGGVIAASVVAVPQIAYAISMWVWNGFKNPGKDELQDEFTN